jgi:meso-butanediol dehydrogenase/(S,S)-butanediol dehydrogenase/diacetyl reductase
MNGLSGKTVVVTGGSSGIGAATVARFRDEGCTVFDLSRHPSPGGIACDVGDLAQVEAAFAQIGRVDVVINNAGVSFRHRALEITPDEWQQVLRTNFTGVFNVAQVAGRLMLGGDADKGMGGGRSGGVIINLASTNALVGHPFYADYNATKAAVLALTRSLALEWAPTVRVTAVCPGYVMTPMQEAEYTPEMIAQVNAKIPLGRHARPEELAALLAFMACDEAAYMTGSAVVIDGGETAGGLASR